MASINSKGLDNKIKWLTRAVKEGDYYSKFLLEKLKRIRSGS